MGSRPQPKVHLIPLNGHPDLPPPPVDLRWQRVEEFFQARALAKNTELAYRRDLARFLAWSDRPWGGLTPRQLAQFKQTLNQQNLAPASINRILTALISFLRWLRITYPDQLLTDPTLGLELEKLPSPPAQDLSKQEIAALFEALNALGETGLRDAALLAVLCHGLRAQEACRLNVGDYDGVRLTIRQAKSDSTGTVPLRRSARAALERYLCYRSSVQPDNLDPAPLARLDPKSPLFLAQSRRVGDRLGYQGLYYAIKRLGRLANIPDLTPHRLRHTYATELLLRGMDSFHARTLTRHRSESSFKRYAKRAIAAAAEQAFYAAIGEDLPDAGSMPDPQATGNPIEWT